MKCSPEMRGRKGTLWRGIFLSPMWRFARIYNNKRGFGQFSPFVGLLFKVANQTRSSIIVIMLKFVILACAVSAIHACGNPVIKPIEVSLNIVGGIKATEHSWPWMTEVILDGGHYCGATLISDEWILSAAHCFGNADDRYQFSVGGHNSGDTTEGTRQTFSALNIFKHPGYNSVNYSNDVALIRISGAQTDGNPYVEHACLPSSRVSAGTPAYVTGWGDQETTIFDDELQQVMVPIVDQQVCQDAFRLYNVDETMICAGFEEGGKDSCQGSSGGPMVVNIRDASGVDQWTLVGVVSWGVGCAEPGKYGVYADVSERGISDWIQDTMAAYP